MKSALRHILCAGLALVLSSKAPQADDISDQERARAAVESGDIVPLALILERVEYLYHGSIIEVELESEEDEGLEHDEDYGLDGGFLYEIKLLTPQGNLLELLLDARNAELIRVRGYGEEQARKNEPPKKEEREP